MSLSLMSSSSDSISLSSAVADVANANRLTLVLALAARVGVLVQVDRFVPQRERCVAATLAAVGRGRFVGDSVDKALFDAELAAGDEAKPRTARNEDAVNSARASIEVLGVERGGLAAKSAASLLNDNDSMSSNNSLIFEITSFRFSSS